MSREEILKYFKDINHAYNDCTRHDTLKRMIDELQESCDDMGEVSDGYHTFNQLYHQRAVLFATIVNQNKDKSWKSFKHSDGNYCFDSNGEWFIVGIDTPQGSYTYHYAKEYWDMFDCEELECGKEWDGHTEEDVTRLLSLQNEPCEDAISRQQVIDAIFAVPLYKPGMKKRYAEEAVPAIFEKIKLLPPVIPAERVGQWIPVSERLPEEDGEYLVTIKPTFKNMRNYIKHCDFARNLYLVDEYDFVNKKGVAGFYKYDSEYGYYEMTEVIAWCELPEPYKASPTGAEGSEE